ncbi:hypothetical protein RIF29_21295 [Crotalaria pallida]|uniref:Uncharacterized protein n=1 Tax=Crotalaria pallida TaxID=3830 RepID=A0AAN9F4H0_CROPI
MDVCVVQHALEFSKRGHARGTHSRRVYYTNPIGIDLGRPLSSHRMVANMPGMLPEGCELASTQVVSHGDARDGDDDSQWYMEFHSRFSEMMFDGGFCDGEVGLHGVAAAATTMVDGGDPELVDDASSKEVPDT